MLSKVRQRKVIQDTLPVNEYIESNYRNGKPSTRRTWLKNYESKWKTSYY